MGVQDQVDERKHAMKQVVHLGRLQGGFVCLEVPYVKLVSDFCQRPGLCFHKLSEPAAW